MPFGEDTGILTVQLVYEFILYILLEPLLSENIS